MSIMTEPKLGVRHLQIVESTLREGEQFSTAFFSTEDKVKIAKMLDEIGVDYIELTTPMASSQSFKDCETVAALGLKAKVLTHTRCHIEDVRTAIDSGVDGVQVYMATSGVLRQHSHGLGIDMIIERAQEVIECCKEHNVEIRFSCEDTFRSDLVDTLRIYKAMDELGVDRVGLADTVGVATPFEVQHIVSTVREAISCDIEFHTHDDTGCAIANAFIALTSGVTHVDTCILGIGERNGITPLGGFLGRLYTVDKDYIVNRYSLPLIAELEAFVSMQVGIDVPFNNCITGSSAFTHKAGVHTKAIMQNPGSYEVIDPADFGVGRSIQIAHRLTGWNAVQERCTQMKLNLTPEQVKAATIYIKNLADRKSLSPADVDAVLLTLQEGGEPPALHGTAE